MLEGKGSTVIVVEEVQSVAAISFPQQLAAGIDVIVSSCANSFLGTQATEIVGVGNGGAACGCSCQLPAILPGEGPPGTVIVAGGIAGSSLPLPPQIQGWQCIFRRSLRGVDDERCCLHCKKRFYTQRITAAGNTPDYESQAN